MDFRQMEYFVALVDERQFTRAAAVCHVSQSGLSSAIRNLEEELGTPLFVRSTRRVEPTDAGLALLPFARAMLQDAAAGRDAVVRASHNLAGALRVGAEQCLGVVDVPPLLERFHRRYPLVSIEFIQAGSADLVEGVRREDLDVAFIAGSRHPSGIHVTELGRRPLVLISPPEHPLGAVGRQLEWSDLSEQHFIDLTAAWGVRAVNDAECAAHGVDRAVRCTVNDIHTLLDLVQRGMGVAIVPKHVVGKPQAAGLVSVPLPTGQREGWVVSAATGMQPAATAVRLLEILDEAAASERGLVA